MDELMSRMIGAFEDAAGECAGLNVEGGLRAALAVLGRQALEAVDAAHNGHYGATVDTVDDTVLPS